MIARVRKAVIPAAGLGTRFLPATKAVPKEMLPIVDIPTIQLIVEEAVRSGIEQIVLVTARHKEAIENHFDHNYELEHSLDQKSKHELSKISKDVSKLCEIISVRQKMPRGLGHAILCAEPVIGNEPFAILLGDDLIDAPRPCTQQLIDVYSQTGSSVVAVMNVEASEVSKYGICNVVPFNRGQYLVKDLVEKPKVGQAPSRLAIPGRYVLLPSIFAALKAVKPDANGEIQLTEGLRTLAMNEKLYAAEFTGTRYDAGDRVGFIDATLAYALKRPDIGPAVIALMKKHLGVS